MDAEIVGTDDDSRHWFAAETVVRSEPYRSPRMVPRWLNPFRFRARRRARSRPDWNPELEVESPVHIFIHNQRYNDTGAQFEQIGDYFIFTVAEDRNQAHEQVTTHLETGPFQRYALSAPDPEIVEKLEEEAAVQEAKTEYRQFNPYVNGEYTPNYPETHLLAITDRETISGVVWIEMTRAQLRDQISRAQSFQQREPDSEDTFWLQVTMGDLATERFLTILDSIDENDDGGWICAPVSIAEDEPEVAAAVVLNDEVVKRIRHVAGYPELREDEMAEFGFPIPNFYLDIFVENAQTAVEMDSPGVAGVNFLERE